MEDKHVLELCNHLRGLRESQEPTILTYYEIDVFSRELRFDNDVLHKKNILKVQQFALLRAGSSKIIQIRYL